MSLAADSLTLAVGGYVDNNNAGAVWLFTRTKAGVAFTQLGSKLVPPSDAVGPYIDFGWRYVCCIYPGWSWEGRYGVA